MRAKERYEKALAWFEANMPVAESELHFENEYQLLVAVMLSRYKLSPASGSDNTSVFTIL